MLKQYILKCRILHSPKEQVKSNYRLLPLLDSEFREKKDKQEGGSIYRFGLK